MSKLLRSHSKLNKIINRNPVSSPPGNSPFSFAWLTDIHIGRAGTFDPSEPQNAWDYIGTNFPNIAFVIASGDITDHATQAEFISFESKKSGSTIGSKTWYILPGNHDEKENSDASGGTADGPADYLYYDASGYPRRWAFSYNGYKFIGFTTFIRRLPDSGNGSGNVSATDLAHIETELSTRGTDIPILIGHFPLSNTLGNNINNPNQTTILTYMAEYDCHVYMHGHRHIDFTHYLENNIHHVNGECLAYSQPYTPGSFMIVSINGNDMTIDTYSRNSPYSLQDSYTFTIPSPDATSPTLSTATIQTDGIVLKLDFNEIVKVGTAGGNNFTLSASGGAVTATYSSGSNSTSLYYALSRSIAPSETVTISYTQPGNGIEDAFHNDLATFSGTSVTNSSTNSGWLPYSAVFDGTNDYLTRGASLTGIADGKTGSFSFWVKMGVDGSSVIGILSTFQGTYGLEIYRYTSGQLYVYVKDSGSVDRLNMRTGSNTVTVAAGWVHVCGSWDLATSTTHLYVNGVSSKTVTTVSDGTVPYATGVAYVGALQNNFQKFNGSLAEVWFDTTFIDFSVQSNREKFRTVTGHPVPLASDGTPSGLTQPILYLHNQVPSFETNLGSGGGMTETGTLVDGGSDMP